MIMDIPDEVYTTLKSYVYMYSDPRTKEVFYIGKGRGNRACAHLKDKADTRKVNKINAITKDGQEPKIEILRYGLSDSEAALVEAAAIQLIGLDDLTNRMAGHHENSFGRIDLKELIATTQARKVEVEHKAILITINKLYRTGINPTELYEATRGIWRIGTRREKAEYAMAVYRGVVKEVYKIKKWHPAGTLKYQYQDQEELKKLTKRWEFEGEVATDLQAQYVGNSVGMGGRFPIRYKNI